MTMRHLMGVSLLGLFTFTSSAVGQVVLNMPAPPRPNANAIVTTPTRTVNVGDVALYRYASARYAPRPSEPRFYQQYTWYDMYQPYYFYGFTGRRFLAPPVKFQFWRPFPFKGMDFKLH